jgi:hypothetical protein
MSKGTLVVIALLAALAALGYTQYPEAKRYLKMERM